MTFRVEWEAENESMISVPGDCPVYFSCCLHFMDGVNNGPGIKGEPFFSF